MFFARSADRELHKTHFLLKPREELFEGEENINLRDALFRSSDIQLIDAKGACGSYTHVLGRLLQRAGFEVRIAQMKCGENWGCHILLEANIDGTLYIDGGNVIFDKRLQVRFSSNLVNHRVSFATLLSER